MANSTLPAKPAKPSPDFPLFPHASGRWAKKVRGKLHYFGKWTHDPTGEAAKALWEEQKNDLLAGRTPGRPTVDGLKLKDLCNHFMTAKEQQRDAGGIKPLTFVNYHTTCKMVIESFGKHRLVDDLAADDFNALRSSLVKRLGVHGVSREVQQVRTLFKYGYDAGLIDKPMRFGPMFKRPGKKQIRKHRQQTTRQHGKRMFEAAELRTIIDAAKQPLKAMILLGINCGFGNHDCGTLPRDSVDLEAGWLEYERPKTAVERRCPLWPETIEAIRDWQRVQPIARRGENMGYLFVTRRGALWSKDTSDDPISKAMRQLLLRLKLLRYGRGFYALRHTFATVGLQTGDRGAVQAIMGHDDGSVIGLYDETGPNDDRLRKVTTHVHTWLYPRPTVG